MHIRGLLNTTFSFLVRLWREFNHDHCPVRASGLAFASLLALVPVSALLFSLFSGFGAFTSIVESIQAFVIKVLVPTSQEQILDYVNRFVENTRGLGVFGLIFFLVTSVLLLAAIQRNFDAVWGTGSKKNTFGKFATYVSVLIVGSFLLSIALNVTGAFRLSVTQIFSGESVWVQNIFIQIFPRIFLFAVLFFMIRFLPAGRVINTSALIGAVVGAMLWEAARGVFVFWVSYVIRLSVVYGSLAVIPIFLIWLYVAWSIVLLSLEVAFIHQHRGKNLFATALWEREPSEVLHCGLELYLTVAARFATEEKPPTTAYLSDHLGITERDLLRFIEKLQKANLLIAVGERERGYMPARELSTIKTAEVVRCLFGSIQPERGSGGPHNKVYSALIGGALDSVEGTTIKDVIDSKNIKQPIDTIKIKDSIKTDVPPAREKFHRVRRFLRSISGK